MGEREREREGGSVRERKKEIDVVGENKDREQRDSLSNPCESITESVTLYFPGIC